MLILSQSYLSAAEGKWRLSSSYLYQSNAGVKDDIQIG